LLKQLQKVDASIAHKHTQQIDCTGVLNTDAKVDGFTGTDWVVQADRREWLKNAELQRRLRARPGASFHTRWVHSHAGNWEEAVADRQAKRGAKM
jgi:ribonuclease HI